MRPRRPIPGQERGKIGDFMIVDTSEHIREPGVRIDVIEFFRLDQRIDEGGALATAFGAGEEPGFPAERDLAQSSLRCIVRYADAAVVKESGEAPQRLSM